MDYAALFAAGVAGLAIGGGAMLSTVRYYVSVNRHLNTLIDRRDAEREQTYDTLAALRRNCFLTDTDGVRRRYDKVSRAVRERAEGSTSAMPF